MKKNDVFVTAVLCFEGAATWWVHVMTVLHAKHYIYMRIIYSVLPEPKNTELAKKLGFIRTTTCTSFTEDTCITSYDVPVAYLA